MRSFPLATCLALAALILGLVAAGRADRPLDTRWPARRPGFADTTLTLGRVKRDLTADGVPDVLSLTATGQTLDSLDVTFEIRSSERILYSITWPMTRAADVEGNRRRSPAQQRALLARLGGEFFGRSKFKSPAAFLAALREQAPLHIGEIPQLIARQRGQQRGDSLTTGLQPDANTVWEEMQAANVTIFEFATRSDWVTAIAWSPRDKRFYRLLECC